MSDEQPPISPQYGAPSSAPGYNSSGRVVGAPTEWWRRLVAIILDGLILSVPNGILGFVLGIETTKTDPVTGDATLQLGGLAALTLLALVVSVIYSGFFEGSQHGQSIGKMAMRIQVRDADTLGPIGFGRAASRRFVYQVLFLPLGIPGVINGLSPLWDARRQAWHDKVQHTLVVNSA
jgi:uncharacterized RDD family membrane protein YckC